MTTMQVKYGDFTFAVGEASIVSFAERHQYSQRQKRTFTRTEAVIDGLIIDCDGEYDIETRIKEIRTAFMDNDKELVLLHSDGTKTSTILRATGNDIVTASKVNIFIFPSGDNAEYATRRRFRISLWNQRTNEESKFLFWHEEIIRTGDGGGTVTWQMTQDGPIQIVDTFPSSIVTYVQRGRSVGFDGYDIIQPYMMLLPIGFSDPLRTVWNPSAPRLQLGNPLSLWAYFEYPFEWEFVYNMPVGLDYFPRIQ